MKHTETHAKFHLFRKKLLPAAIFLIIIGVVIAAGMMKMRNDSLNMIRTKTLPEIVKKLISDNTITFKEIRNLKVSSGLYTFDVVLDFSGTEKTFPSYMTKDKKLFFSSGTNVDQLKEVNNQKQERKPMTCQDVNKNDKPNITAFVVSNCPFGLQMQRAMKLMIGVSSELAKYITVRYIGEVKDGKVVSMHGEEEAQENLRQICIRQEQPQKYWPYVSCYMKEGKSTDCLSQTGVNMTTLTNCMNDPEKGITYAKADFDLADKFSISSSPTIVVNDTHVVSEFDFGGRTPQVLRDIVCCAGTSELPFCKAEFSKDQVATSFTASDAAQNQGASSSCGQ